MSTKGHKKKHNKNKENELPAAEVIKHLKYNWDMIKEQTELAKSTNNIILLGNQLNSIFGTHHTPAHSEVFSYPDVEETADTNNSRPLNFGIFKPDAQQESKKGTKRGTQRADNQFGLTPVGKYDDPDVQKFVKRIYDLITGALTVLANNEWKEANADKEVAISRGRLHLYERKSDKEYYYDGDHLDTIVRDYNNAVKQIRQDAELLTLPNDFKELEAKILYSKDTAGF
jgi:hypothetical protein